MKVSLSPDIILCGWLDLKHELTPHKNAPSPNLRRCRQTQNVSSNKRTIELRVIVRTAAQEIQPRGLIELQGANIAREPCTIGNYGNTRRTNSETTETSTLPWRTYDVVTRWWPSQQWCKSDGYTRCKGSSCSVEFQDLYLPKTIRFPPYLPPYPSHSPEKPTVQYWTERMSFLSAFIKITISVTFMPPPKKKKQKKPNNNHNNKQTNKQTTTQQTNLIIINFDNNMMMFTGATNDDDDGRRQRKGAGGSPDGDVVIVIDQHNPGTSHSEQNTVKAKSKTRMKLWSLSSPRYSCGCFCCCSRWWWIRRRWIRLGESMARRRCRYCCCFCCCSRLVGNEKKMNETVSRFR